MRKLLIVLILSTIVLNSGCAMFIDGRIKRSASIDYALVKTTLDEIQAGEQPKDSAYDTLRMIEPNMKNRLDYFYGKSPDKDD